MIAMIVASVLYLLLSVLPITTNPVINLLVLACAMVALGIVILTSLHWVPESHVDIFFAFGSYERTLGAGVHLLFPWEKLAGRVPVSEFLWVCPLQVVPLSYDEDIILSCIMSYQVVPEHAHLTIRGPSNWEGLLHHLLITTLQTSGTLFRPYDFLPWVFREPSLVTSKNVNERESSWEYVNRYLLGNMRATAARWGVQVNWTAIRDVKLAKHATALVITEHCVESPSFVERTIHFIEHNQPTEQLLLQSVNMQPVMSVKRSAAGWTGSWTNTRVFDEEQYILAYQAVQNGSITDPQTIREFATRFESVAQDPQLSEIVSFDAAHAADILFQRACMYERRDS